MTHRIERTGPGAGMADHLQSRSALLCQPRDLPQHLLVVAVERRRTVLEIDHPDQIAAGRWLTLPDGGAVSGGPGAVSGGPGAVPGSDGRRNTDGSTAEGRLRRIALSVGLVREGLRCNLQCRGLGHRNHSELSGLELEGPALHGLLLDRLLPQKLLLDGALPRFLLEGLVLESQLLRALALLEQLLVGLSLDQPGAISAWTILVD